MAEDTQLLIHMVFDRILARRGQSPNADELPEPERVVLAVVTSKGTIDNGGFQYLFEGHFSGDPSFHLTRDAYVSIGAANCARAFDRALAVFPGAQPSIDIERRLAMWHGVPEAVRKEINSEFWNGDDVDALLAEYIDSHRAAYEAA